MEMPAIATWTRPLSACDLTHSLEDGVRYEILEGALYMTPYPSMVQQQAVSELLVRIGSYLQQNSLGKVFGPRTRVVLNQHTVVFPDLVYVTNEHLDFVRYDGVYGAPDLLVEVGSSTSELMRIIKLHKYAAAGVPNYWIVDPDAPWMGGFEREGSGYVLRADLNDPALNAAPPLFPGLLLPLGQLWGKQGATSPLLVSKTSRIPNSFAGSVLASLSACPCHLTSEPIPPRRSVGRCSAFFFERSFCPFLFCYSSGNVTGEVIRAYSEYQSHEEDEKFRVVRVMRSRNQAPRLEPACKRRPRANL